MIPQKKFFILNFACLEIESAWSQLETCVNIHYSNQEATVAAQPRSHPRPILVKLQSVWDRRLLLAGKWKLRDTEGFREFFLRADLSAEEREKIRAKYLQGRNRESPPCPDV